MSVTNKQTANATTFNAAYMSRTADTDTTGIVGLSNTDPASGASIANVQELLNDLDTRAPGNNTTFTLANNTASQNVTGLIFDSATYLSARFEWTASRESISTGANRVTQRGACQVIFDGSTWILDEEFSTRNSAGVTLDIHPTTGQVLATTDDQAGDYQASTSKLIFKITSTVEAL